MTIRVFDLRGVFVFRYDGETPPELERAYNPFEDRYEVNDLEQLEALPVGYELVEDADPFRVEFQGDPPDSVAGTAVFVEEGPMTSTVLCPDEKAVEKAVDAGGTRLG